MWKVLLVISAVVLAGSGVIAWNNQKTLEVQREQRIAEEKRLAGLEKDLAERKMELETTLAEVASLKDEAQKLQVEVDTAQDIHPYLLALGLSLAGILGVTEDPSWHAETSKSGSTG